MEVRYEYYMSQFGGEEIPVEKFKRASRLANTYLEHFTFGRVKNDTENADKILNCLCEMCEAIYLLMFKDNGTEKKSENIDGYSVSYVTERADGVDKNTILEKKLFRIAKTYLEDTGLLYLGV